jgi:CRP/FNR family cyclic AMP-dependent transcriptional regulator
VLPSWREWLRTMVNLGLFRHSEGLSFGPGQTIFGTGDPGDRMYVVISSEVDILVGSAVLETAGPGSIIGEMALIDNAPRSATVKARTECQLAPVEQRRFEFLVQNTPYFAIQVMQIMADRLRKASSHLVSAQTNVMPA